MFTGEKGDTLTDYALKIEKDRGKVKKIKID